MKQILYLEDTDLSQRLMKRYLVGMGEVTGCAELAQGEALLRERSFDLLITDFMFPEGNALSLIYRLRQTMTATQLPIIVVSASMGNVLLNQVLQAGANDAVQKPLHTALFRESVQRMLEAPYVRVLENPTVEVRCFSWVSNGSHYVFSPDLCRTFSAQTKEAASNEAFAVLDQQAACGIHLGKSRDEEVVMHEILR